MSGEKVPLEVPRGVKKDETPEEREARLEKERLLGKDELQQRQKEAETKATETTKADVQSGKDLSEEDQKLKDTLDLLVTRITEPGNAPALRKTAIDALSSEIRSSTSSMTALPKPLKFLRPHFETLRNFYDNSESADVRPYLADVLSVLAMVMGKPELRESLKYRILGSQSDIGAWGHEYVRHVATEVSKEWDAEKRQHDVKVLERISDEIIPFNMKHNAEVDAVDLLMEVSRVPKLVEYVNADNVTRVCSYLIACAEYCSEPDERILWTETAFACYMKTKQYPDAIRLALRLNDGDRQEAVFKAAADDRDMQKQLAFISASQQVIHRHMLEVWEADSELKEIAGNANIHNYFIGLARDLETQEVKTPEDAYKTHLSEGGPRRSRQQQAASNKPDSARQNLASSFVNGFLNCGYSKDSLLTVEASDWLFKNKDHAMFSAAASLGMIFLWDVETGYSEIDKYSYSTNSYIKGGALLASGIISSGITSDMNASFALLSEHLGDSDPNMLIGAVLGLGISYAGTQNPDIYELLLQPLLHDSLEVASTAALALGLVYVGSGFPEAVNTILDALTERKESEQVQSAARLMGLAVGLLFLGKTKDEDAFVVKEIIKTVPNEPLKNYLLVTLDTCRFFGTGSVLEIQKLLSICGEHPEKPEAKEETEEKAAAGAATPAAAGAAAAGIARPAGTAGATAAPTAAAGAGAATASTGTATAGAAGAKPAATKEGEADETSASTNLHQSSACLGIALLAMGEELGAQMAMRALDNILQYADLTVRRAMPFALALLNVSNISNARVTVVDTLSKLTHDSDEQISQNAILALGIVGAGTNNSRIAGLLRALAVYYAKDANHLFLVRIAQGFIHLGKGLLSLDPYHDDNLLFSPKAAAALLILVHACMDMKTTILGKRHYLLYSIVPAIRMRSAITLNEKLEQVPVKVRQGQAVDTIGQAGKPKSVTGFQTHDTPICLSKGDRAEIATDEWIPVSSLIEGFVIVKKNPDAAKDEQ